MLVYVDASAAVKILVAEDGTDLAADLWDGADLVLASQLVYPEVRAALAAAVRAGRLSTREGGEQAVRWDEMWSGLAAIDLDSDIAAEAGRLAEEHLLRGSDAVHLASALLLDAPDVTVAVWDRRLHAAALAAGLQVAPAQL